MKQKFSKEEMQLILQSLDKEFDTLLKSEENPEEKEDDKKKVLQDLVDKASESEDEEKEKKEALEKDDSSEKKEEHKEEEKEESKEEEKKEALEKDDKEEPCPYDESEMEELKKIYGSMSPAERKAHKEALEKCGEMYKSESASKEKRKEDPTIFEKLSGELASVKQENEVLKKNIDGLIVALNKFVSKITPERKAITSIEYLKKSEESSSKELTKSEIDAKLRQKIESKTLSFSDRELINKYYLHNLKVDAIKHLLD